MARAIVKAVLAVLVAALAAWQAVAQAPSSNMRDPKIAEMLAAVSSSRIRSRIEKLVSFGTRQTLSETTSETRGIGAARRWIKSEFERISVANGGRLQVAFDSYTQEPARRVSKPVEVVNVVATLPGRQAESANRVYIVGGHYDSRRSDVEDASGDSPGANDDASGTAAVMEMAEVMSKYDFDATLVFVAFAGEEQGLLGSGNLAKESKAANRDVAGMITNDIIGNTEGSGGRRDNRTVRLFSEGIPAFDDPLAKALRAVGGEFDSPSRQLARSIRESAALYLPEFNVKLVFRTDRYLRGGDHIPFLAQGFAAIRMTEPSEAFERQHQDVRTENGVAYGDVVDAVDFDYVANVARVNIAGLGTLAMAPPSPRNVKLANEKLENSSTLHWDPVTVPDLAGFEVVWRDTTAADWEHALYVGNATTVTLPELSKDTLHFGVRSVDKDGHRSQVSFALP